MTHKINFHIGWFAFMNPFYGVYKRKNINDAILFVLLSLFILASDSWLFKQSMFLKQLELFIRFLSPFVLLIFFKKYPFPSRARVPLLLYGILVVYMFFVNPFTEKPQLVFLNMIKFLSILAFPFALLLVLRPFNFSQRFLYVPVVLGALFAIQTIILFILVQSYHPPPSYMATLVGYKNMQVLCFGIWGYGHGMMGVNNFFERVYRAQSFFGEPTEFASFMEVAMIMSFGFYRVHKHKLMLLSFVLCTVSLILTFSMTAYVVVFFVMCAYWFILNWRKMNILGPIIGILLAIVVIAIVLMYFYGASHPSFYGRSRIGLAFGHSPREITIRVEALINSLQIFWRYPLGIGFIGHADSAILQKYPVIGARLAPLGWMIYTGLPGIIIQGMIILYMMRKIVINHLFVRGKIERYVALSFFALILHQCLAGAWFSALFFYLFVALITIDSHQFLFSERTTHSGI